MQAVAETLKLGFVAATSAPSGAGEPASASLVALLLPLLIGTASPAGTPSPALTDLAVKLLSHLGTGRCAASFRSVVSQLSPAAKQRLQAVLTKAASGAAAAPKHDAGVAAPAAARPTIQLKSFRATFNKA